MRILLDSHTALWWMDDPEKIHPKARDAIRNPKNTVFLSAVSTWELGLKVSKGKLLLPSDFPQRMAEDGIEELPFTNAHAIAAISLPPFHGDPFDRALIAQCMEESLTFATRDGIAAEYRITVLPV